MERLLAWALSKGAKVHKLAARGRQFVAAEDVQAGDTLISIPQHLLLHTELAFSDGDYAAAFRQLALELGTQMDERHLLCLLLVLEKARQKESAWEPYISILPEEYDDPYWWSDDQRELVQGTRLGRAIKMHYAGLKSITASMNRLEQLYSSMRPESSSVSVLRTYRGGWALQLAAARWARSAVWSRSFTIRMLASGARNTVAMVPVLDMIDHSPNMEVVWHTGRDGSEPFQFVPLTDVSQGSMMCNNYGRRSSDELLLAYGFMLDGPNAADHLVVSLAHSRMPAVTAGSAANHLHSAGNGGSQGPHRKLATGDGQAGPGPMDDGGDEDQATQQQAAEDLQRALAMTSLNLSVDQRLGAADPLPTQLLLGAQLCLLPPSHLYLWTAQLQQAHSLRVSRQEAQQLLGTATPMDEAAATAAACMSPLQAAALRSDVQQGTVAGQSHELNSGKLHEPLAGHKRSWNTAQGEHPGEDVIMAAAQQQRELGATVQDGGLLQPGVSSLLAAASAMHIGPLAPDQQPVLMPLQHEPPSHLVHQLQALVSMRDQLQSRLDNMAGEMLLQAAALHASSNSVSQKACEAPPRNPVQVTAPSTRHSASHAMPNGTRVISGLPQHSRLALSYVTLQRMLVFRSLDALAQHVSTQIHAATEPMSSAQQQHLIKWAPLGKGPSRLAALASASRGGAYEPSQSMSAGVAAWASIDPDVHVDYYLAWLKSYGLVDNTAESPSMVATQGPHRRCLLQEVVHTRAAPAKFLARRSSSREILNRAQDAASTAAVAGAAGAKPNGRVRGPPSSSRTFTMKGQPNPSQALPAGLNVTPTTQSNNNMDGHKAGSNGHAAAVKRVSLPQGLAVSLGIDSDYDPVAPGVVLAESAQRGQQLLQVPLACCLCAPTKQQLVCSLMASAQQLLLPLLVALRPHLGPAGTASASGMAGAVLPLRQPHEMLVWHLMHSIGAPACARLGMSDVEGVQLLTEMLEDSPAGSAYQEAFDSLKSDFTQLRNNPCRTCPVPGATSQDHPMARLLSFGSSASLYFWAVHVVDRCAMEVTNPWTPLASPCTQHHGGSCAHASAGAQASVCPGRKQRSTVTGQQEVASAAGSAQHTPGQGSDAYTSCWILAPVVSWVPAELRQALMTAQLQQGDAMPGLMQPEEVAMSDGDASCAAAAGAAAVPVFGPQGQGLGSMVGTWSSGMLCVRAACELRAGLHLSPLLLLPNLDLEELMSTWGPEALPWQQLLHRCIPRRLTVNAGLFTSPRVSSSNSLASPASVVTLSPSAGTGAVSAAAAATAGTAGLLAPRLAASQACADVDLAGAGQGMPPRGSSGGDLRMSDAGTSCVANHKLPGCQNSLGSQQRCTVLYELYICPGETDKLCHVKLVLLAAAGLGCVHHLTEDLSTEHLVMCALKICLADKQLLQHPLAQRCMQLHAQVRAEQVAAGDSTDAGADSRETLAPGSVSTQSLQQVNNVEVASRGGQGSPQAAKPASSKGAALQELHELQPLLLSMLARLPEDHSVCKASRKQLRGMVHDARKNTKRRLKQLEAVHNVVATHTTSSAKGASFGVVGALGGSYHPLGGSCALHEGVRLYLQAVCDVLDTWADHLGLNRQSDSMNKRHKTRSDE